MDKNITDLISKDEFELELYEAAVHNLADLNNKLRFNNFAYAMRELSRHVLHRLAPSDRVLKCSWYKNLTQDADGITRMQRAIYATQGGLSDKFVRDTLNIDPSDAHKTLRDAINRLSQYTHVEKEVFDLSADTVDKLASEITHAFSGFAAVIRDCRSLIIEGLEEAIHENTVNEVLSDSLLAVDEIATHFSLEEVYVDSAEVTDITHDTIHLLARGNLGVILQWGSNSDIRRGEGAELDESFPFTCELTCTVSDDLLPEDLEVLEDSLMVDTREWYGADDRDAEYGG